MAIIPTFFYYRGYDRGYEAGIKEERLSWQDDGKKEPYLHETTEGYSAARPAPTFYKVQSYFKRD